MESTSTSKPRATACCANSSATRWTSSIQRDIQRIKDLVMFIFSGKRIYNESYCTDIEMDHEVEVQEASTANGQRQPKECKGKHRSI